MRPANPWRPVNAPSFVLNNLPDFLPELLGGSADLTGSNNTDLVRHVKHFYHPIFPEIYIHYGVREFAMAAIMNGLALPWGLYSLWGYFSGFCRLRPNAIRLSALIEAKTWFMFSRIIPFGLGEDGPTRRLEQAAMAAPDTGYGGLAPCRPDGNCRCLV